MNLEKLFPRIFGEEKLRIREKSIAPRLKGSRPRLKKKDLPKELEREVTTKAQEIDQEISEAARSWAETFCPENDIECQRAAAEFFQRQIEQAIGLS